MCASDDSLGGVTTPTLWHQAANREQTILRKLVQSRHPLCSQLPGLNFLYTKKKPTKNISLSVNMTTNKGKL